MPPVTDETCRWQFPVWVLPARRARTSTVTFCDSYVLRIPIETRCFFALKGQKHLAGGGASPRAKPPEGGPERPSARATGQLSQGSCFVGPRLESAEEGVVRARGQRGASSHSAVVWIQAHAGGGLSGGQFWSVPGACSRTRGAPGQILTAPFGAKKQRVLLEFSELASMKRHSRSTDAGHCRRRDACGMRGQDARDTFTQPRCLDGIISRRDGSDARLESRRERSRIFTGSADGGDGPARRVPKAPCRSEADLANRELPAVAGPSTPTTPAADKRPSNPLEAIAAMFAPHRALPAGAVLAGLVRFGREWPEKRLARADGRRRPRPGRGHEQPRGGLLRAGSPVSPEGHRRAQRPGGGVNGRSPPGSQSGCLSPSAGASPG